MLRVDYSPRETEFLRETRFLCTKGVFTLMIYSVFVQPTKKHVYNAIVLGFPFLRAEGYKKRGD